MKMAPSCQNLVFLLAVLVLGLSLPLSDAIRINIAKTRTTDSPKFVLEPGSVVDKYFYDINFPKGHIAMKYLNAEVIDEQGNPLSLHETYLHHWVIRRYYARTGNVEPEDIGYDDDMESSDFMFVSNSGLCHKVLGQYYGLGAETRKTDTHVLDPYAIEIGNPAEIPAGSEERWMLNVHAIDTRVAEDRLGCTECRCDPLYNVTIDEQGQPLMPGYTGGSHCCYDGTRCSVKQGYHGVKRGLYLRYTVKWTDWSDSIVPVKIYILKVTDRMNSAGPSLESLQHDCLIEYNVEACSSVDMLNDQCFDNQWTTITMPTGGYIVYAVAHQHTGGRGSTLYGEDGRVLCTSIPIYGQSEENGDEAGHIIGMSTCYRHPGSIKIKDGETVVLASNYSSSQSHTGVMGVMGHFYILVAEHLPKFGSLFS